MPNDFRHSSIPNVQCLECWRLRRRLICDCGTFATGKAPDDHAPNCALIKGLDDLIEEHQSETIPREIGT